MKADFCKHKFLQSTNEDGDSNFILARISTLPPPRLPFHFRTFSQQIWLHIKNLLNVNFWKELLFTIVATINVEIERKINFDEFCQSVFFITSSTWVPFSWMFLSFLIIAFLVLSHVRHSLSFCMSGYLSFLVSISMSKLCLLNNMFGLVLTSAYFFGFVISFFYIAEYDLHFDYISVSFLFRLSSQLWLSVHLIFPRTPKCQKWQKNLIQ